jgi:hypothetical protein
MVDMKQSRDQKREAYVDSNIAMQRIRHIEEEEEMGRVANNGRMSK